jgi:hypothetical protein
MHIEEVINAYISSWNPNTKDSLADIFLYGEGAHTKVRPNGIRYFDIYVRC